MKKELLKFCQDNNLNPFSEPEISFSEENSIFKTRDAKAIYKKVLTELSSDFIFSSTKSIFQAFTFTKNINEIKTRQDYFKSILYQTNIFLKEIKRPRPWWKPKYDVLAVTENEKTFIELNTLGCAVKFITSQEDLSDLEKYDLVQVIDCDELGVLLEHLPQSVFIDSIEDIYLERYLEELSGWQHNLQILEKNITNPEINELVKTLCKLLPLLSNPDEKKLNRQSIEQSLDKINLEVQEKIKEMTISGNSLFTMLSKSKLPQELESIITNSINNTNLPFQIFTMSIPVTIDEQELDNLIKRQEADEFTDISKIIQRNSDNIKKISINLKNLEYQIILFDFESGISNFSKQKNYPIYSNQISISNSENIFLTKAQPISFHLNEANKCSILTGANSGGKTTLIEHIIQLISIFQLGLPSTGNFEMPIFTEVYYFAKNKGSANKGAFETLLTQMSKITPGEQTIILADEIESVTEPGVAGRIVSATAEYFIEKKCFLIIATHLGQDIQKVLPPKTRIDGIEAKGLDENFELIVDHNPVLGRLAHSTPELIVEKMASSEKTSNDYFTFLHQFLKNK